MRALVLRGARDLAYVEDHPEPACPGDGVVIAVEAAGLCRSDVHVWAGGWEWEDAVARFPVVLGHEVAGRVIEVGSDVGAAGFGVGDRVAVPFQLSCGSCTACRSGETNHCAAALYTGNSVDGGFADLMPVARAARNIVVIPDELGPAAAAALGCRYMTAWRAISEVGMLRADEWVLVTGAGGLGLACIQVAAALGAGVVAVDPEPAARRLASVAGATHVLAPSANLDEQVAELTGGGVQLSVDTSGVPSAAVAALRSLVHGGRHVQTGLTDGQARGVVSWPADRIVMRELRVLGSLGNARADFDPLLSLIESGRLRPDELTGRVVSLTEACALIPDLEHSALPGLWAAAPSLSGSSKESEDE